jgi:2-hydroxychromene-2-carboxylate isomerase
VSTARFYFSFRSPYSWLAHRDLTTRYRDVCGRISWIPFWEPDRGLRDELARAGGTFSYVDMSRAKARYILADVRRLVGARGTTLAWPVDREPWWEVAHLGYLVAVRRGYAAAYLDRVYAARWEQGRDISRPETIADVVRDLGDDPREYVAAATDPAVRAQGLRVLLDIDADGVFGVPFFVLRRDRYWGLDRLAPFVAALRHPPAGTAAGAGQPDWAGFVTRGADQGHAGGCG